MNPATVGCILGALSLLDLMLLVHLAASALLPDKIGAGGLFGDHNEP